MRVASTHGCSLELHIFFPDDYPSKSLPVWELKGSSWLDTSDVDCIASNLNRLARENAGQPVVHQWVEWLREYLDTKCTFMELRTQETEGKSETEEAKEEVMAEKKEEGGTVLQHVCEDHFHIWHGEPFTDRKSTFQAHVAEVHTKEEVQKVLGELKCDRKIAAATHNILAYRLYDDSHGIYQQDCDDDGETAAGGRLLQLLQMMDRRNVVVVVSRWFGGILLHGDRFKHINNVARILLLESKVGCVSAELTANTKRKH